MKTAGMSRRIAERDALALALIKECPGGKTADYAATFAERMRRDHKSTRGDFMERMAFRETVERLQRQEKVF